MRVAHAITINSVYFFGHGGALEGVYDKFHLVPFGEYLPMESFFHAIGIDKLVNSPGGFTAGSGPRTFAVTRCAAGRPACLLRGDIPG